jgi:hypothetical protein
MGRFYHTHRTRTIGPNVRVTLSTGVKPPRRQSGDADDNLINAKQIATYSDVTFHD